nr:PREDICTED: C2 domain-containing protein 5 [Bemisia tabaci]
MPGKIKVKILAARNLPIMDRSAETTDAFCEVKLGTTTYKTDVYRKSLNPQWNSEWYRFEMDDAELQDEPLQIRVMDHDTYSANDAIGKLYLDLNPLLHLQCMYPTAKTIDASAPPVVTSMPSGSVLSGWFPVYDTMHGIRGEVHVTVKVELFSDFNKFRESSCGVQFFSSSGIPYGHNALAIHGFVEELIKTSDPEYQWIEKIRTPRVTNEARQTTFFKLSGEVHRKIGLKVIDMGGNAVIGYIQCFDLEGESGIVVRGIGTVVTLVKIPDPISTSVRDTSNEDSSTQGICKSGDGDGDVSVGQTIPQSLTPSASKILSQSPAKIAHTHRRSSDSELSVTPKGNSLTGSSGTGMNRTFLPNILLQPITDKKMFELHDYPFLTMTRYPPGFIKRLGGTVSARSVKLLERSTIDEEPETRDTWWNELRLEVRSHARALACNVILGYSENTAYNDDVCILSAIGTAATIYLPSNDVHHPENITAAKKKTDVKNQNIASSLENRRGGADNHTKRRLISENGDSSDDFPCSLCHVPFKKSSMPFRVSLSKCLHCKRCFVPEILMTTIEPPEGIPILGEGCFLQAFVKRPKRDNRGELNAKEISDSAPFLEYELHRQLLNKLRVKGMNSIFSLKITISVGDRMITGHAAGTAIYLAALPILSLPTVTLGSNQHDSSKLEKIQKDLSDSVRKNRERFLLRPPSVSGVESEALTSDSEESEVDLPEADFATGNMDLCILEVDDNEDVDLIPQLIESPPPRNLIVTAAEVLPGVDDLEAVRNLQMFTQVWRGRIPITAPLSAFNRQFRTMLHKVYFKVRDMIPCALSGIRFLVDIPEADELQITVFGMILGLAPCEKSLNRYSKRKLFMKTSNSGESVKKLDENDLIFNLEEVEDKKSLVASSQMAGAQLTAPVASKFSGGTPAFHVRPKERYGIDITPLSFVPGGKIDRYLGNMNLFFIREGTSIRENGGIGVFIHSFVTDVLAIMRAHVAALGGNAVVAYFMNQCILQNNPNKNQAQCLINVGGDAVLVNYRADD